MAIDSSRVYLYKQIGESPDMSADTLLSTDVTVSTGEWAVSCSLNIGRHKIYAVSIDKAGNKSIISDVVSISRLPLPMYVSESTSWVIGELNQSFVGMVST